MRRRIAWLASAAVLALAAGLPAGADTVYGKQMVHVQELPAEAVARFARHDAKLKARGEKPGFMTGGSEDWSAPTMALPSGGNPYRLVVRVAGTVTSDGDAGSVWMAGWGEEGQVRSGPVTGTSSTALKAGERLELTGATGPATFRQDRNLQPVVMFLGANNLKVDSVTLEVWSGVGKSSFVERVGAWSPLLVGLVFLGLFLWWRRG